MSPHKERQLHQRIGFAVMRLRQRRGLTALVLAERSGVHRNTICRIESGLPTSVFVLSEIAEVLGVGLDALLSYSPRVVHPSSRDNLRAKKAAKVVCGTKSLFEDFGQK
jgi:transcriptional regulator with XRE-family HTH domain